MTHSGSCGRASITVSVSITSLCFPNMYGPQCDQECVERAGQNTCNYLGQQQCLGDHAPPDCDECTMAGFQTPGCVTCIPDYYPAGICTTFCQPRDDSLGHFTCNSLGERVCLSGYTDSSTNCVTCAPDYYPAGICTTFCQPRDDSLGHFTCNSLGERVCLSGYTDTSTNCVTCTGNFREPDCTTCDINFQGTNCGTCATDYYPASVCTTFCQPRNDSLGHYTCDSLGRPVCLPGYTDTNTNCVTCAGNFKEPDCVECDQNFQKPTCEVCIPKYTDPSTGCRTCAGNFKEPDCTTCDDNFQGTNCDTCAPHYYPAGICTTVCQLRNDSFGHYTCDSLGLPVCLPGYIDPSTNCVTCTGNFREPDCITCDKGPNCDIPSEEIGSDEPDFIGSVTFYVIIGVVGVPLLAFICMLVILCGMCLLSNNVKFDCSCPRINGDDCCGSFLKWLSCGLKYEEAPVFVCIVVILGILAAPVILLIAAVILPSVLIGVCLFYSVAACAD